MKSNRFLSTKIAPRLFGLTFSCCALFCFASKADDWPQWRGPQLNGISAEKGWSDKWPDNRPNNAWKTNVGLGLSSVVVAKGRVYTMGNADNTDTVFCFDAETGKGIWKHSYPSELGDKYFDGGTAGSPTVDGDFVYTISRWGDLFCLQAATGKVVWTRNLQKDHDVQLPDWGFAGSPRVYENLLLLNVGEAGMAVDKKTGKTVWQSANKEAGYSTPLTGRLNNQPVAFFTSGQAFVAVEPATGKEKWRMRWITQYGVNAADPVIDGDKIFISSGYGKGSALLKPAGTGTPEVLWQNKSLRSQMNSAVLLNGHLYGIDGDTTEKASLKCVVFATGEVKWTEPGIGSGGLIAADNKLIVLAERGEVLIAPADPAGFKPTTRAQVLGGKSWTAPVLANGLLFCRNSRGDLVCVKVGK